MASEDTKERILDAAEELFAHQGFAGTSLRALTRAAGVNLAAVHYHFGSKQEVLRAVLGRIVEPTNRDRLALLARAEDASDGTPEVEAILAAFIAPDLRLIRDLGERGVIITRFLGRSHTEPSEIIQELVREHYGDLGQRFATALHRALPDLPLEHVYERLHWVVGILTYILADAGPTATRHHDDVDALTERLVSFAAAGLRAPATKD